MDELLGQLLELCELDAEAHALRGQLALYPQMLAESERREAEAKSNLERSRKLFEKFHERRRSAELEVATHRERIAKYQAQQNQVKNNKEYEAINEGIRTAKEKIDGLDFEGLEALEQEEAEQAAIVVHRETLQDVQTEAASERERIAAQQAAKSGQLAEREHERERLIGRLPEEYREPYALLDEKYPGSALASIVNGACSGCSMNLVTQRTAEVKRGTVGVRCDNCARILYDAAMREAGKSGRS